MAAQNTMIRSNHHYESTHRKQS